MPFDPTALLQSFEGEKVDALIDTMVLAADADGEIGSEERDNMIASVRAIADGSAHDDRLSGDRVGALIDAAVGHIADQGRDGLIASVKSRIEDAEGRKAALGVAIAVSAADGIMRTSERELIMDLADALEVDRDEAADMVRDITRP